jgi:hypothetical protein
MRIKRIGCCLFVVAFLIGTRSCFSPPDWVEIRMTGVPEGTRLIYVIAEDDGRVRAMNWYHSKVVPWTDDPRISGQQWKWTVTGARREGDLQWLDAPRHGLLARKKDGKWLLWWLGPQDYRRPSVLRYVFGGDQVPITVPDESRATSPERELIQEINIPDDEKAERSGPETKT